MLHVQHYNAMEKMFHGQTLKSATSDYDQRHMIAFRPISVAARSWSYDKWSCLHCQIAKCASFVETKNIPRDDPFPLKSWLELTYPS